MKRTILFLGFVVTMAYLSSCSSGKKSLEQGNYYNATLQAINRLRQNPNQKKAAETLRDSYPLAVRLLENQADNRLASNDPFKWRSVMDSYTKINHMYEEINRSPGALSVVPNPKNYYSQLENARNNAADESYEQGLRQLALNTRLAAKEAFFLFRDVNSFVPGFKDVNNKMAEARFIATLKVVVNQIPVPQRYALSGDFFQAKVEEFLHTFNRNEFVRFYSPAEAESEKLEQADHLIRIAFDDFSVGETHLVQKTEEFSKDSVKVGEVTLEDGTKIPAYNTVKAKLTTFHKEVISEGLLSFEVVDGYNNAILTSEKFPGQFVWFSEWGSFNGDERALTNEQMAITKAVEVPPPPPQDLFIEFTKPIYGQLTSKIDFFYRNY